MERNASSDMPDHAGDRMLGRAWIYRSRSIYGVRVAVSAHGDQRMDFPLVVLDAEDRLKELEDRDRAPYRRWCDEGWILPTPGNIVDYAYVRKTISGVMLNAQGQPLAERWEDCAAKQFNVQAIGFDPWNGSKLVTELGEYDGLQMLECRQGYATVNPAAKEFERAVADCKIATAAIQ